MEVTVDDYIVFVFFVLLQHIAVLLLLFVVFIIILGSAQYLASEIRDVCISADH